MHGMAGVCTCLMLLEGLLLLDEPGLQDHLRFVVDGFPRTATKVRALIVCVCFSGGKRRLHSASLLVPAATDV
jgi:hypothetical protein